MTAPVKTDTSPAAERVQAEALRRLAPAHRLELAVDMSLTARALFVARLRAEHPEWSDAVLHHHYLQLAFPDVRLPPMER